MSEILISDLPEKDTIDPNDSIIIDTPDGLRDILIRDIVLENYNTSFGPVVENNTVNLNAIDNNFFAAASSLNINTSLKGSIALYYRMSPKDINDIIVKNQVNFTIPFNFIGANSLTSLYPSNEQILANNGGILLPPGTYKTRAIVTLCIRNPGKYYENSGIYVGEPYGCNLTCNLAQVDAPERTLLVGDIKYAPVAALKGKTSIETTVDGFFYICKFARIALRISTDGNLVLGDGSLNNNVVPKSPLINYAHYNGTTYPAQIMLERVSEEDIYDLGGIDLE